MASDELAVGGRAVPAQAPPTGAFTVLWNQPFRMLLLGALFTQLGQWVQSLGQGWLIYRLTGSPLQLSLVAFAQGAGLLIVSPIGGVLSDRVDRRKLMLGSQFAIATMAILLTILVFTDTIRVWHLYITAFVSQGSFGINNPVRQALVNDVVGHAELPRAIAINAIVLNTTRMIGPSLGGILLVSIGPQGTYGVQAGCVLVALACTFRVVPPARVIKAVREPFFNGLAEGVRYVRSQPDLSAVIAIAFAFGTLGWAWQQLMPAYAAEVLHVGKRTYGFLMTSLGAGSLIGAFYLTFGHIRSRGLALLRILLLMSILIVVLGLTHNVALSLFLLAGLGAGGALTLALNQTIIQTHCDDRYRGRVISIYFLVFGLQPMGTLPAGALASAFGTGWGIFAMGAGLLALILPALLFARRLRRME